MDASRGFGLEVNVDGAEIFDRYPERRQIFEMTSETIQGRRKSHCSTEHSHDPAPHIARRYRFR